MHVIILAFLAFPGYSLGITGRNRPRLNLNNH
ncbi:Uncharacterised protein [Shimwellia blattae]|nr:Uncharacterised protein [Shimwellia blattae]VEC22580.1 Uncharacterised protein [Shimwellia blattae]